MFHRHSTRYDLNLLRELRLRLQFWLIALAATKPYVIDLFELATGRGEQEFEIRQLRVHQVSPALGRSLREMSFGSRFGVIVIGIKSRGQEMLFNPSAEARLAAEDMMITGGRDEKFREIEQFLAGARE